ncbi:UMP kinase [Candidatus Pacearchaeota archaeon]|nr:UMP kinase [Candidatus Pacearchaeota archaeon]|tara:strand:+ start:16937 stop:17617 length:681 start_codon:yes stop_codon:yes gene_type:complete
MQEKWVISLGGSRIVQDEVDLEFLKEFRKLISSHPSKKFVVVTGGGKTVRTYVKAMRKLGKTTKQQSKVGIAITRFHAIYLMKLFGESANSILPKTMKKVESQLRKNHVVFTGALRYGPKQTTDSVGAKLASHLGCSFINLTNVKGLYTANPKTNKNAKFIKNISWKDFNGRAQKIKYSAGQHFVLDQTAAKVILKNKVTTYIVGSLRELDKIIRKKSFKGTLIKG